MHSFLWISAFLLSSSNQSYSFLWLAVCKDVTGANGYFRSLSEKWSKCPVTARLIVWRHHPCQWSHPILSVKVVNAPCHGTAIHLSVLDHARIGFTILLRLSLHPAIASFKFVTAIPSQILLGIPQTRFRLSGSQEWLPIGSSLWHEDTHLTDSVRVLDTQENILRLSSNDYVEHHVDRFVVVKHAILAKRVTKIGWLSRVTPSFWLNWIKNKSISWRRSRR